MKTIEAFLLGAFIGAILALLPGCATVPEHEPAQAPATAHEPEPAKPTAIQTVLDFFEHRD